MQNTLGDLNNHLFAQIERLGEEDLKGEKLVEEMNRAKSICTVSSQIINNAALVLSAQKMIDNRMNVDSKLPKMLEG